MAVCFWMDVSGSYPVYMCYKERTREREREREGGMRMYICEIGEKAVERERRIKNQENRYIEILRDR